MNGHKKETNSLQEEGRQTKEEPGGLAKPETISEENWSAAYKNSFKNIDDIAEFISFKEEEKTLLKQVTKLFHMRVPQYYFSLIKNPLDINSPIRKQCVPSLEEIQEGAGEKIDPLGEEKSSPIPCLVHRYPDRVLLIVTGHCFMYCRHCTRKRLWRSKVQEPTLKDIELALHYVKENKQIREIIISGGDPLTLATEKIDYILSSISRIPSIEAVRIGTRAPVVLPQRIDDNLCAVLKRYDNLWCNIQFNHPDEITEQSIQACKRLQACGIPISNQSVLLKGVNDNPEIMKTLCQKLQAIRVRPYYLYQCDPIVGAAHFRTSIWKGINIIEKLRGHTGGMCIPTFVIDGPDGKGKIPLGPNYLLSASKENVTLRNYKNETVLYHNPKE
jgi:lysine 2,3-aminomutase